LSFEKTQNEQFWVYGRECDPGFVVCDDCGAAVPNLELIRIKHGEWHEKLRRAVDEHEMLG